MNPDAFAALLCDWCLEVSPGQQILLVSTTPNSIVLDIDTEENRLFFHQVEPAPVPRLVRRLEV